MFFAPSGGAGVGHHIPTDGFLFILGNAFDRRLDVVFRI
jgi:hypothetical protein